VYRIALWLTSLGLLAAAGCGGGSESPASGAEIPQQVAQNLAAQADAIAATYESGDVCGAAQQADALLASVTAAVEGGRVPAELQDPLTAVATDLVNEINCPKPEEQEEDHKGKGNGKGRGNGNETTPLLDTTMTEGEG
jgi:hypothetical protein